MTKLTLLGAAAILATALATPAMSQEATQEPGMIGFNLPELQLSARRIWRSPAEPL